MLPALLGLIVPIFGSVLEKIIPDKPARDKAVADLTSQVASMDLEVLKGQQVLNVKQAESASFFVAGARPFAMWGTVAGLLYAVLVYPYVSWACALAHLPVPPAVDADMLYVLVTSLLGLAGIRGWESVKGVARSRIK